MLFAQLKERILFYFVFYIMLVMSPSFYCKSIMPFLRKESHTRRYVYLFGSRVNRSKLTSSWTIKMVFYSLHNTCKSAPSSWGVSMSMMCLYWPKVGLIGFSFVPSHVVPTRERNYEDRWMPTRERERERDSYKSILLLLLL